MRPSEDRGPSIGLRTPGKISLSGPGGSYKKKDLNCNLNT